MALADYAIERKEIHHKGKVLISVRGLNSQDISVLVRRHLSDLRMLWSALGDDGKLLPGETIDVDDMIFSAVVNAPDTIAKMIALASDEPNNQDAAAMLSAPLQILIVSAVVKLTMEDIGGPLALLALVNQMVQTGVKGRKSLTGLSSDTDTSGSA